MWISSSLYEWCRRRAAVLETTETGFVHVRREKVKHFGLNNRKKRCLRGEFPTLWFYSTQAAPEQTLENSRGRSGPFHAGQNRLLWPESSAVLKRLEWSEEETLKKKKNHQHSTRQSETMTSSHPIIPLHQRVIFRDISLVNESSEAGSRRTLRRLQTTQSQLYIFLLPAAALCSSALKTFDYRPRSTCDQRQQ